MIHHHFVGFPVFWLFGAILMVLLATYVASDAIKFGQNGLLWALLVLFMPFFGLLIYVVIRSTWVPLKARASTVEYRSRRSQSQPSYTSRGNTPEIDPSFEKISTQFCTSCGFENSSIATFCNNCGAKIQG